VEKTA